MSLVKYTGARWLMPIAVNGAGAIYDCRGEFIPNFYHRVFLRAGETEGETEGQPAVADLNAVFADAGVKAMCDALCCDGVIVDCFGEFSNTSETSKTVVDGGGVDFGNGLAVRNASIRNKREIKATDGLAQTDEMACAIDAKGAIWDGCAFVADFSLVYEGEDEPKHEFAVVDDIRCLDGCDKAVLLNCTLEAKARIAIVAPKPKPDEAYAEGGADGQQHDEKGTFPRNWQQGIVSGRGDRGNYKEWLAGSAYVGRSSDYEGKKMWQNAEATTEQPTKERQIADWQTQTEMDGVRNSSLLFAENLSISVKGIASARSGALINGVGVQKCAGAMIEDFRCVIDVDAQTDNANDEGEAAQCASATAICAENSNNSRIANAQMTANARSQCAGNAESKTKDARAICLRGNANLRLSHCVADASALLERSDYWLFMQGAALGNTGAAFVNCKGTTGSHGSNYTQMQGLDWQTM